MTNHRGVLSKLASIFMAVIIGASTVAPGLAVTPTRPPALPPPGDDAQRAYHDQTGKLRLLAAQPGSVIAIPGAQEATTVEDKALAALGVYAQEFGLSNPVQELQVTKSSAPASGKSFVRYQQVYQGVPVLAGEMIVSTDEGGNLLSMSGEVSPQPSLSVTPDITSEQARATALEAVAKWYELTPADLTATEPEVWIYDERLLKPSTRPIELVWRMEVTATALQPIDELVLVNAHTGGISLHFNQIDTAWGETPPTTANVMLAPTTYYVATTGNDSNSCTAPASPCATINGAIGKAADGDTIKVAVGTYTGTGAEVVLVNKSVTLSGGWDATFTTQSGMATVDGQEARRGITVTTGVTVTTEKFVIQNGLAATFGGGIHNSGNLTLNATTITRNIANYNGAGIYNTFVLVANNSSVIDNSNSGASVGGGIFNTWSLSLNNSVVSGNYPTAIYSENFGSTTNLTNTSVTNNLGDAVGANGNLSLTNSTVSGNGGRGVSVSGTAVIANSTISGNTSLEGAGVFCGSCSLTLNNSTVSNNVAFWNGGGIYRVSGTVTLKNSIVARNTGANAPDCSGVISSAGYNLIGNNSGCTFTVATGDQVGTSSNPINPKLGQLQNNGGTTLTHGLLTNSPALEAGNPAVPGSGGDSCLAADQRGNVRPNGSRCDIGAFEGITSGSSFPLLLTYSADGGTTLPGNWRCGQNQPICTNGSDPHADAAHTYARDSYNFYATSLGRDSLDNNGMVIVSTVHYCHRLSNGQIICPYANAFWNGSQVVYGDKYGFPLADDVVAHELTHGVTDYESNLFYYYQSGAINESFSDLWGEFVDLTNSAGNDSAAVRWKMGEDVSGLGALRDMKNPPAYGDPDKMTSSLYYKGAGDNGGVHTNSGVNNKAVYLMTDGGTFNGKTVTGLGIPKVAAIYYEVQTNLLTSGSDYADLYYALSQACATLVGGAQGITNEDCQAVRDAADAVQMNLQPSTGFNPEAALCPAGMGTDLSTQTLFFDNMESVTTNWTFGSLGFGLWNRVTGFAASGVYSLYGSNSATFTDSYAAMSNEYLLPANAFLHFKHAFGFEDYATSYYDGGVLEYSTDNGTSWTDAKPLFSDGKNYGGKIMPTIYYGNPLGGRDAFVADSHGYVSSRYNLSTLAGQNVRFRWRTATDNAYYDWGWFVDDVRIYTCTGVPSIPSLLTPTANGLTTDYTPTLDWADSTPGLDHYQIQVDDNIAIQAPLIVDQTTTSSTFTISTPLNPASTYYWRVRAFNTGGFSSDWSPVRILYTAVVPPTINFPASSVTPPTTRPLFDWANVAGASSYTLQISTRQNFTTFVLNAILTPSAYVPTTDLPRNTLLFWRVRANGVHGSGDWSRTRHFFSADPPGVPVLVSPANNATAALPPALDWNDSSPAADYYEVQISTISTFATLLGRGYSGRAYQSNYTPIAALSPGTPYFWRVRAVNAAGQFSQWSAVRSFTTPP
jgi:Zn-dependent metalloprotease